MPVIVAAHVVTATLSVILGTAVMLTEKGGARHKWLGRLWALTMCATALISFDIRELHPGHLSWVHGLSLLTFASLARAIWAIRHGNVRGHRRAMRGSFFALVAAGVAAVATPHRLLNLIVTGWIA
ncbi:DUF2306 domain-containing protein [Paraburkholderia unamae]|uniref:Membrane protein n=1 Tax=Paraburkholderia unamae TaxID=219649 RepID=A0ABX5KVJ3_9BURK|nr:DUF2306 domain-containing protein [Paraburkholderia unamae]PVX84863.1 putative membrane protein [Paraburkholderia unamae]RAR66043.1 putative membrane protein [Paraburkholderia unamae]CAG9266494.1 Uncharacterized membrane protein [Paraburkholderia unamae]